MPPLVRALVTGGENKKGGRQADKREGGRGKSWKPRQRDAKGGWGRQPEVRDSLAPSGEEVTVKVGPRLPE